MGAPTGTPAARLVHGDREDAGMAGPFVDARTEGGERRTSHPARAATSGPPGAHAPASPPGQRALLLVTDGAPSDIDVHDPQYLIEDARMAVAEARAAGVRTGCIAVDSAADACMRRIFGWHNYCAVRDAPSLPARLARMHARLVCQGNGGA